MRTVDIDALFARMKVHCMGFGATGYERDAFDYLRNLDSRLAMLEEVKPSSDEFSFSNFSMMQHEISRLRQQLRDLLSSGAIIEKERDAIRIESIHRGAEVDRLNAENGKLASENAEVYLRCRQLAEKLDKTQARWPFDGWPRF